MTHQFQYEAGKHSDWLERCIAAEAQRDRLKEALSKIEAACLSEDDSAEEQLELIFGIASNARQALSEDRNGE